MTALTKEQLLTPVPVELEEVEIPQMGGSVWVKGMTVSERTRFENNLRGKNEQAGKIKAQQVRERLLVQCVVTEDATRTLRGQQKTPKRRKKATPVDARTYVWRVAIRAVRRHVDA